MTFKILIIRFSFQRIWWMAVSLTIIPVYIFTLSRGNIGTRYRSKGFLCLNNKCRQSSIHPKCLSFLYSDDTHICNYICTRYENFGSVWPIFYCIVNLLMSLKKWVCMRLLLVWPSNYFSILILRNDMQMHRSWVTVTYKMYILCSIDFGYSISQNLYLT